MNQGEPELEELLDFAVGLARGAGEITLRHFRQTFTPTARPTGRL